MSKIRRSLHRECGGSRKWCRLEVELRGMLSKPETLELSISGSAGVMMPRHEAEEDARLQWHQYFEDDPEALGSLFKQHSQELADTIATLGCTAEAAAAELVLAHDGPLHGLDVVAEDGSTVYVGESFGQITETLSQWFPEVVPYLGWHLNHMRPGCEHQDELGWGPGSPVVIDRATATAVQLEVLDGLDFDRNAEDREIHLGTHLQPLLGHRGAFTDTMDKAGVPPTQLNVQIVWAAYHYAERSCWGRPPMAPNPFACERTMWRAFKQCIETPYIVLREMAKRSPYSGARSSDVQEVLGKVVAYLEREAEAEWPKPEPKAGWVFEAKHSGPLGAPCPECGYRYGHAWTKRTLPREVVDWVLGLEEEAEAA